jgi:hypothetical protein
VSPVRAKNAATSAAEIAAAVEEITPTTASTKPAPTADSTKTKTALKNGRFLFSSKM